MIYFILNPVLNHVKIGYTMNKWMNRMSAIQNGNSVTLEMIAYIEDLGDDLVEQIGELNANLFHEGMIHEILKDDHIRGEWFEYSQEMKNLIDKTPCIKKIK